MSIVYQNETGYFVDHNRFVMEESCGRQYKRELFDLRTPFYKDLEAAAEARSLELGVPRTRKRKKKKETIKETPVQELEVRQFLSQLQPFFQPTPTPSDLLLNNKPAREAVKTFLSSPSTQSVQNSSLMCDYSNPADETAVELIYGQQFLLPPHSQLFKRDIGELDLLVKSNQVFSLITIDPPWSNRFIKRKRKSSESRSYHSMDNSFLATLPIAQLCTDGALVAIWCTNSPTHIDYLINTLLPIWKLDFITTWFWIKVTTSGEFCVSWNGPSGKQPFERIVLARRRPATSPSIPEKQLVVSVPCAIHSFKPPLLKLLQPFLPETSTATHLELFARSLLPRTVSWGDQVPLLQHVQLFEPSPACSTDSSDQSV